MLFSSYTDIE